MNESRTDSPTPPLPYSESEWMRLYHRVVEGTVSREVLVEQLLRVSSSSNSEVNIDLDRRRRCNMPEVIYALGKTEQQLLEAISRVTQVHSEALATRVDPEQASFVASRFPNTRYVPIARTLRVSDQSMPSPSMEPSDEFPGYVAVVTAGTTDLPVALEAVETLAWFRVPVRLIQDVGVAGPYRLIGRIEELRSATVVIVIAGMEGALPSVVGGQVGVPVIAVPTSVGYGSNFQGLAALLGMLNSCASNVTVVNIDAGFKAGYVAGTIVRSLARSTSTDLHS